MRDDELYSALWKVESIIQAKYIVLSCATNMKPIDRPTNIVWPGPSTGCDAWNGSLSVLEIWCFYLLTYVT
jgi:hypothetical protein